MTWYESGGEGTRTALLLHGLGATSAVWKSVERALQERGSVRWLAADLSGHGGSDWQSSYSVGQLAARLAELVQQQMIGEVFVVGHSLGAYVGLALASAWFGITVRGVVGIGPKVSWSAADLKAAQELATRPVRWYQTGEEALTRYRRVSGLGMDIAAGEEWLARGSVHAERGWRLAQDPRTFAVTGAPFASLVASATVPRLLAPGERGPMGALQGVRMHPPPARGIPRAGPNAHIEEPG